MRFWIIKGNPARNDLDTMLVPDEVEPWVTRKPPRDWAAGDGVFFWKRRSRAPGLRSAYGTFLWRRSGSS
jgi:hypothetical protein